MTDTVVTDDRPAEMVIISDWLRANGIDELLPERPIFQVDTAHIWYRAFQFKNGERGMDAAKIKMSPADVMIEDRVVPLTVPLNDAVRAAFKELHHGRDERFRTTLEEHPNKRFDPDA